MFFKEKVGATAAFPVSLIKTKQLYIKGKIPKRERKKFNILTITKLKLASRNVGKEKTNIPL